MNKITQIWRARKQILEGLGNNIKKKEFVEEVYQYRKKICESCVHNDGQCMVPGTGPCCGACGCSLKIKLRSMSAVCGLDTINETPLWFPVLTPSQEDEHLNDIENDQG